MCKKSSGSFQINFTNEKEYSLFGYQYARCYGNFETRAHFSKPVPEGQKGYQITFEADCGCDTVIGEFNKAYKKTFGDNPGKLLRMPAKALIFADGTTPQMQAPASYNINLISCGISDQTLYKRTAALPYVSYRAAASPATAVNATAIDSQMNYALTDVSSTFTQAVANTTLFAQAAARAVLKGNGVDINKSDYLKTKEWYDEVIAQLADLGFIAHSASGGNVNKQSHSGEIKLKEIVTAIVSAYIAGPELTAFENLANLLTSDPNNSGVTGFLDFWWSAASSHTQNASVAWGPVKNDQGSASVTCVYMNIDVAFTDWRSLFVSFHSENVEIASSAVTLNLNMETYDRVKGDITNALGDNIAKHVKNQKLNFGS
jgi:hypothetical protein